MQVVVIEGVQVGALSCSLPGFPEGDLPQPPDLLQGVWDLCGPRHEDLIQATVHEELVRREGGDVPADRLPG